jgi:sarcosine oxidase
LQPFLDRGNDCHVDFLIVGNGMFGAATARYLAPHAAITVVGPAAAGGTSGVYGAHHDEGRMVGDLSRDIVWAELNRLSREGMTDLDPALITPCGALTVTTPGGPPYLRVAAEIRDRYGADVRVLDVSEVNAAFPMARLDLDETILYQPTAGHFSPRRYVALATQSARADGATIIPASVRNLRVTGAGVEAELHDGRQLRAETAIVATGAFAAGSDLLTVPVALRAKSEIYAMAELDEQQAAELGQMPCINRTIRNQQLSDLYVLPPIRYPDGRIYLKCGANTMIDHWLAGPGDVRSWYDSGNDVGPLAILREILSDLLPSIRVRAWHVRRCADAYTAHRRPYIDFLQPGRLVVALGGNGRGAQAADAVGQLAAGLALTGQWQSPLPREVFRHVPANGRWNGMTLLRDQVG